MKKFLALAVLLFGLALPAAANPLLYLLAAQYGYQGAQIAGTYGIPVFGALCYGMCHTPPIHIIGTEQATVGLDWASLGSRSRNVYGIQMSLCGGGVAEGLYGIQTSIIACGWVDDYDISKGWINGLEFAPIAVRASVVNGFQMCPFYARAATANGFQCGGCYSRSAMMNGIQLGIVNRASRMNGIQLGIYNSALSGYCLQIGLVNYCKRRRGSCLPVLNLGFR